LLSIENELNLDQYIIDDHHQKKLMHMDDDLYLHLEDVRYRINQDQFSNIVCLKGEQTDFKRVKSPEIPRNHLKSQKSLEITEIT
jgi:hypothetical protein